MKHATTSDSAFTVSGANPMTQELNDSEDDELDQPIKDWIREIRIEKLMETKYEK